MTSHIQQDKSMSHKWFEPYRRTHWTIVGSVAVIMVGSLVIFWG